MAGISKFNVNFEWFGKDWLALNRIQSHPSPLILVKVIDGRLKGFIGLSGISIGDSLGIQGGSGVIKTLLRVGLLCCRKGISGYLYSYARKASSLTHFFQLSIVDFGDTYVYQQRGDSNPNKPPLRRPNIFLQLASASFSRGS